MLTFNFPDDLAHLPSQYEGQAPKKGETVITRDKSTDRTHQFRVTKVTHFLRPAQNPIGHPAKPGQVETDVFLEEIMVVAAVGC